jgi:hypothetical protein
MDHAIFGTDCGPPEEQWGKSNELPKEDGCRWAVCSRQWMCELIA